MLDRVKSYLKDSISFSLLSILLYAVKGRHERHEEMTATTNVGDIYGILPSRRLAKDQNWEYLLLTWCRLCPLPVSSSFIEPRSYPYWGSTISDSESNDGGTTSLGLNISKSSIGTSFEEEPISWPLATQNILSPSRPLMKLEQQGTTLNNSTMKDEIIASDAVDDQVKVEMKDRSSSDAVDVNVFSTGMPVLYVNEDGVASSNRHMIPPRRPQCSPKKKATEAKQSLITHVYGYRPPPPQTSKADRNKRNEKLKRVPPPPPPPPPPPLSTHPSTHVKENIAAKRIQALVRSVQARESYYNSIYSAMRIQALVRGFLVRSRALDEKCQAAVTVDITSDWDQLRRFVSDENWPAVESTLEQYPEVAEKVDPSNGEMLLHMICRHPNVPVSILDMVIVLYPKALRHSDSTYSLPLHHAAAHDNMMALEIIYSVHKDGVNHINVHGQQPFHMAADSNAIEAVNFLYDETTEQHKEEVRALEQELAEVNSSLADIKELRMQESTESKRQIQELEAKVQAWVELGILKDVFSSNPPPQPP